MGSKMKIKRILLISDICVQVFLMLTALLLQIFANKKFSIFSIDESAFICFYFVLGSWQVMSCIYHAIAYNNKPNKLRKIYHVLLFVHIGLPLLSILGLFILLFSSPAMALYYLIICITDYIKTYHEPAIP